VAGICVSQLEETIGEETWSVNEWGFEAEVQFPSYQISARNIRTNGNAASFTPNFIASNTNSVVFLIVHTHPSGNPPSPDDIVLAASHEYIDLLRAATDGDRDFIANNFTVIAIGNDAYTIKINDPEAVWDICQQNGGIPGLNAALSNKILNEQYSYSAALLSLFGNSITLFDGSKRNPDQSNPIALDNTGKNTLEETNNCN